MNTRRIFPTVCLILSLLVVFTGCASIERADIAWNTTEYNLALEKAQNEMILLNIVRAYRRHPMYFTALTDIKSGLTYSVGLGAGTNVPLAKFHAINPNNPYYALAPTASYSVNPIFEVAPLATADFVNGMLMPVKPDVFTYYWQEAWPPEMLLYLFIHRIETPDGDVYWNTPYDNTFACFQQEINDITHKCDKVAIVVKPAKITTIDANTTDLKGLAAIQQAGLKIVGPKDTNQKIEIDSPTSDYILQCSGTSFPSKEYMIIPDDQMVQTLGYKIYLRSPQSMLYYLGQIVRYDKEHPEESKSKCGTKVTPIVIQQHQDCCQPSRLFVVNTAGAENMKPSVTVDYEGARYEILSAYPPNKCPADVSMETLSLMTLITTKQTASTLPPPTGVTTTISK